MIELVPARWNLSAQLYGNPMVSCDGANETGGGRRVQQRNGNVDGESIVIGSKACRQAALTLRNASSGVGDS